jgi:hypothetical protein
MRLTFCVLLLLMGMGCGVHSTPSEPAIGVDYEMPANTVDCDNANGNPKLCTVERDESDDADLPIPR